MNTISSSNNLYDVPALIRVKNKNQKLVKILNNKMFKGYREIKQAKEYIVQKF